MGGVIDRAICLRVWDWSETSQTALLFLRSLGALRVLAKGSRRPNAPFSVGLDPVTAGEARVFPRSAGGLSTLASWDLEERFEAARHSLLWFHASLYMTEVVSASITELDPHPALFDILESLLRSDPAADPLHAVLQLQWAALDESGHRPDLDAPAAEPGAPGQSPASAVYWFSPLHGSLVFSSRDTGEIWRVRAPTVDLLRSLARRAMPATSPITFSRAARLLDTYLRYVLGAELRSFEPFLVEPESGGLSSDR